jgi:recombination protein RecA
MYGKGISHTGEIVDAGVETGVIKRSGAWFYYGETRLGQGRDNVKKLMEENVDLATEIENKIMAIITSKETDEVLDEAEVIMPTEPVASPRKVIDIDIAVDD